MIKRKLSALLVASLVLTLSVPNVGFGKSAVNGTSVKSHVVKPTLKLDASTPFTFKADAKQKVRQNAVHPFQVEPVDVQGNLSIQAATQILPQNYVPESNSAKEITVIVELAAKPTAVVEAEVKQGLSKAVNNHPAIVAKEQANFASAVAKVLKVKLGHQYTRVFNGYSLTLPANKVAKLMTLPGVKAVYPSNTVSAVPVETISPLMNDSAPHIGVKSYWDSSYDGAGIKVGVIDTGVDYHHPSLASAYKGGWDIVDNDNDPSETPPDPLDPEAATEHGTHVSGTIVGRGNPDDPAGPTGWVKGVAPAADLYVYRVLGPGGHGTDADVVAGVERAVADGLDVINLSLGSDVNTQESADSVALNNAVLSGVVVVVANGNAGPADFTTGSPAAAKLPISVGASTPPGSVKLAKGASSVTDSTYFDLRLMAFESGSDYKALAGQSLELVYAGLGAPADFAGKDLTGKIAFIKRGDIAFVDKIANAKKAGAAAAIIFNRDDLNGFAGVLLEDSLKYVPTFDMKGADGRALLAALQANGTGTFTVSDFTSYDDPGDLMADFSSRGPALPGLDIKPDISAPGVSIRSSVPASDGNYEYAYEYLQGTSMAAPHIAGAAALVLQRQPELVPDEVKALLMNSAVKLADGAKPYSYMVQGAGRVSLSAAIEEKAVAMVEDTVRAVKGGVETDYHTGSISYGSVEAGQTINRTVDVRDISSQASSYEVETLWYGAAAGELAVTVDTVQVPVAGQASFDISLTVAESTPNGLYEGEVILTEAEGTVLSIPVAVYVGEVDLPDVVTGITLTPDLFSPNDDGLSDTSTIAFNVNASNGYLSLDVYDYISGDWLGIITEEADGLAPGSYELKDWNGVVSDGLDEFQLNDGFYVVIPFTGNSVLEAEPLLDQITPFLTDTEAPTTTVVDKLEVNESMGTIRGQVTGDLLIDLLGDYSGIGVAALFEEKGELTQTDGTIAEDGSFEITVPVHEGDNEYEVYVYDAADNGLLEPAHIILYTATSQPPVASSVKAVPTAEQVSTGEAFGVDVRFAKTQDLYSAEFSLTYDAALTKGTVEPSNTLRDYQEKQNPGAGLIVQESNSTLENGLVRTTFVLSLAGEIDGYTGCGNLATFKFQSDKEGTYAFQLSDVRFLGSNGQEIAPGTLANGSIKVVKGGTGPVLQTISGSITAEGFGPQVAYNETWYDGQDGKLAVVVEALDANQAVVKLATVDADGTYSLQVPTGTYTIRVVIPGHISKSAVIIADADKTLNMGPLTAGDVNGDTLINLADLNQAARAFGKAAPWTSKVTGAADINRDGTVNLLDISFILANYGSIK